jgi:hypothetical protein
MATLKGDSMARQLTRDAQVLDSKSADNIKVRRNHFALAMDSLMGCKRRRCMWKEKVTDPHTVVSHLLDRCR